MGPPSIVPLISPDLMVKNLPAPPPPPSIHVVSDPQIVMNLNPDVPEFVPRSGPIESKTEENCDTIDLEQTNKDNTDNKKNTGSQLSEFGKIYKCISRFYIYYPIQMF